MSRLATYLEVSSIHRLAKAGPGVPEDNGGSLLETTLALDGRSSSLVQAALPAHVREAGLLLQASLTVHRGCRAREGGVIAPVGLDEVGRGLALLGAQHRNGRQAGKLLLQRRRLLGQLPGKALLGDSSLPSLQHHQRP